MNDKEFSDLKADIDAEITRLSDMRSGIKMGFGLAGEFLKRELLETKEINIFHTKWEMRTYRGWYVYPDPMMGDDDCVFCLPDC